VTTTDGTATECPWYHTTSVGSECCYLLDLGRADNAKQCLFWGKGLPHAREACPVRALGAEAHIPFFTSLNAALEKRHSICDAAPEAAVKTALDAIFGERGAARRIGDDDLRALRSVLCFLVALKQQGRLGATLSADTDRLLAWQAEIEARDADHGGDPC